MLFASKKLSVLSVTIDVRILYMVDKHVIGFHFLGVFVSLDLGSRYIIPRVNHYGFVSGFVMALLKQSIMFSWIESKVFNQKLGTLSIPGDFQFFAFLRASFTSSILISSHSCCSKPLHRSSSRFSYSASSLYSFSVPHIPVQNVSTSSLEGGYSTFTCEFPSSL